MAFYSRITLEKRFSYTSPFHLLACMGVRHVTIMRRCEWSGMFDQEGIICVRHNGSQFLWVSSREFIATAALFTMLG